MSDYIPELPEEAYNQPDKTLEEVCDLLEDNLPYGVELPPICDFG